MQYCSSLAPFLRAFPALHNQRSSVMPEPVLGAHCSVKSWDRVSVLLLLEGWVTKRCLAAYACPHHPSDSAMSLATIAESR